MFTASKFYMKYIMLPVLMGILASSGYAQNGFYFTPSIGVGISSSESFYNLDANGNLLETKKNPLFSYNIQAGIACRYKNLRFQSGIQYLRSGYQIKDLIYTQSPTPYSHTIVTSSGSYKVGFSLLGIPLEMGYAISLNKKFSLVPYAGLFAAFTFSGSSRYEYKGERSRNSLSGAALAGYGWFTGWGKVGLQLEYKVNNKISIFGGPSVQYSLVTTGESMENSFSNFHFNLGLNIGL